MKLRIVSIIGLLALVLGLLPATTFAMPPVGDTQTEDQVVLKNDNRSDPLTDQVGS